MNEDLKRHLRRVVSKIIGPSINSIRVRKDLTDGKPVPFSFTAGVHSKRYKLERDGDRVKVRIGVDEWLTVPFVPISELDADYLAGFRSDTELTFPDDELTQKYFARFE